MAVHRVPSGALEYAAIFTMGWVWDDFGQLTNLQNGLTFGSRVGEKLEVVHFLKRSHESLIQCFEEKPLSVCCAGRSAHLYWQRVGNDTDEDHCCRVATALHIQCTR